MQAGRGIFGLVLKQTWYWAVFTAFTTTIFHALLTSHAVLSPCLTFLFLFFINTTIMVQSQPPNRVRSIQDQLAHNTPPFNPPYISRLIALSDCDRPTHHSLLLLHFSSHPLHSQSEELSDIYLKFQKDFCVFNENIELNDCQTI